MQPKETAIRNVITTPFSNSTWVAIGSAWGLMIIATTVIAYVRCKLSMRINDDKEMFQKSIIWAIATACQQGDFKF